MGLKLPVTCQEQSREAIPDVCRSNWKRPITNGRALCRQDQQC